jgi:predicted transposase
MKHVLTAKLKLLTTPEQFQALRQTQLAYRDALNYVSQYSFAHGKKSNQQWLQRECYDDIRVRFGLPAQMACNVPRQVGATYKGLWTKARENAAKLWYDKPRKRFYVLISLVVEVADPTPQTHQRVIGVDVGQRYLAVVGRLDNGASFFAGKEVRAKRKHGRSASKKQRNANRHTSKWAFAELHGFLAYKALLADSMAVKVDADYTSQACPKCGYTCEANRPKKGLLFECQNCHYTLHADLIGARNVALRTLLLRQDWMSTGVSSVRPGATSPDTSDREAKAARLSRYAELRWSPDASPAPKGLGSN